MTVGPLFEKLRSCNKKIKVLQGGTSSGKTVTILQYLAIRAIENKNWIISVIGQDIPNLKKGAIRDFQRFVASDPYISKYITQYNKSDHIYTFKSGSIIEFIAFSDEQDAKNGKRHISFFNEINGIQFAIFWQVQLRSFVEVLADYNPNNSFYVHERLLNPNDREFAGKVQLYISDHRHNPFLTAEEHESIESIADADLWKVYARGMTGKIKGLICGHFKKIQLHEVPTEFDRVFYGEDYGYTNDPTAIVKITAKGRARYFQKLSYEPGISAQDIKNRLLLSGWIPGQAIYSEADPNMINQQRLIGIPVQPAIKGPGSIMAGISKLKEFDCYYVDDPDFEKEILNYKWVMAQDMLTGKEVMTNQPIDAFNHIIDACRFGVFTDSFRHR